MSKLSSELIAVMRDNGYVPISVAKKLICIASTSTLTRQIQKGKLKASMVSKVWFVEIDSLIDNNIDNPIILRRISDYLQKS